MKLHSSSALGHEYDNFLFAQIGEDRNGMPLSVVSLLGRMNLDPWEEAAGLTDLSADRAAHRLASLLRALPDQSVLHTDPDLAAARLIALLPRRNDRGGRQVADDAQRAIVGPA
jgi:hypothetical protein